MIMVGEEELGATIKKGDIVNFKGKIGKVQFCTDSEGKETDLLCFITFEQKSYLVGISGKALKGVTIV